MSVIQVIIKASNGTPHPISVKDSDDFNALCRLFTQDLTGLRLILKATELRPETHGTQTLSALGINNGTTLFAVTRVKGGIVQY